MKKQVTSWCKKAAAALVIVAVLTLASTMKVGWIPSAHAVGGAQTCELGLSTSTTFVQCAAGAGTLYNIQISSTATTPTWDVCYDSATTNGFTAGNADDSIVNASGVAITNQIALLVATTTAGGTAVPYGPGMTITEPPNTPARKFANGLVCGQGSTKQRSKVFWAP